MLAVSKPGRKDQSWKVSAVIDMKVSEQEHIQLGHLGSALSKPESASSASVNQYPCLPVLPYEIAARSVLVRQLRAPGAKYLDCDALRAAGLGGSG
jgi:hypothetical protein